MSHTIFERDIAVQQGEIESKYVLSGRGIIWEDNLAYFKNEGGILGEIVGYGKNFGVHNEWLRIMLFGGVLSLIIFILLQLTVFFKLITFLLPKFSFNAIFIILLFLTYLIDCIGVTPGLYQQYNWYLWGMIGCCYFYGEEIFPINK